MLRAALWTLRQRRYAALSVAMLVVALICIGAGTFEIHRLGEKRHDNAVLQANARAAATPLRTALVPLTGGGPAPAASAIRFRTVTAVGRYLPADQQYLTEQKQHGRHGFSVLTPLRTSAGVVLVVRGFVAAMADGSRPADVAAPPAGQVRITGWLQAAQTGSDHLGEGGRGEITSINPDQQAARLGAPVYQAYLNLAAHQPGTAGLSPVAGPDLSNPTGGAAEWQLLAYVAQWYVFALLALLAPFLVSRAETRDARRRFLGLDPDAVPLEQPPPVPHEHAAIAPSGTELASRSRADLAPRGDTPAQRWERAARLADRYGRSLGVDGPRTGAPAASVPDPAVESRPVVRSSRTAPHRSGDAYHGSYNDYLWQLALGDGDVPEVFADPAATPDRTVPRIVEASDGPADGDTSREPD